VNGDNYADGLGIHGNTPRLSSGAGTDYWLTATVGTTLIRTHQTGWRTATTTSTSPRAGRINGNERPRPFVLEAQDTDSTNDNVIGYTKYLLRNRYTADPGSTIDIGPGNDAYVFINYTNSVEDNIIPWDELVTPAF
jgi:hypothetical protein